MNNYINIINQVAILALIMGVGSFAGKKNLINDQLSRGLSEVLTNIALPTLVVSSFIISYSQELLDSMLKIFLISIIFHAGIILFSKLILSKYNTDKQKIIKFMSIFPNCGAMGVPFIIKQTINDIGAITMPLSMMIIGEKVASMKFKEIIFDKDVYFCSFIRLIIAPIMMFVIISFLNWTPLIKNICIAAEVIPTATVTVMFK